MANNTGVISVAPTILSPSSANMATSKVDTTVGDNLVNTINAVPSYLRELVDEANKLRVQSAVNDFEADLNDYKYSAERGIMNRLGRDVATPASGEAFSSEAMRGVQARLDKHFKGLNASQAELARKYIETARIKNQHEFLQHESHQIREYSRDVYSNAINSHALNLAKMGWDAESRERDIEGIHSSLDSLGKTMGWSQEHIGYQKRKVVSEALQNVLTLLINQENIQGAQKLFNEVGAKYQLDSSALIRARKRILEAARARQAKTVTSVVLEGLQDCYTVGAQLGQKVFDTGVKLPDELKAKYDAATTRQERARIFNEWVEPAIKKSGGDLEVAVRQLMGDNAKEGDVKKIASSIHYGNAFSQITELDALNYVKEMWPDLAQSEQIKRAKAVIDETRTQQTLAMMQASAGVTDQLKKLQAGEVPELFEQIDTTGWTLSQINAVRRTWERQKRAQTDPTEFNCGNETLFATLMQEPVRLSRMSEADLYATRADLSEAQWKNIFDRWQQVQSAGGDPRQFHTDIEKDIKAEVDAYFERVHPDLLETKKKAAYNLALNRVMTDVKRTVNAEIRPGEVVDPVKLQRLVLHSLNQESFWKGGKTVLENAQLELTEDPTLASVFRGITVITDGNLNPSEAAIRATAESFLLDGNRGRVAQLLQTSPEATEELLRLLPEYFLAEFIYSKDSAGKKHIKREYAENPQLILAKFVSTVRDRGAGKGGRTKTQEIKDSTAWKARTLSEFAQQRKNHFGYTEDALEDLDIPWDNAPTDNFLVSD